MIAYLKGKVIKKTEKGIILDIGNIGYIIHLSKNQILEISEEQEKEFFIHSHIREDAFDLYGFQNESELNFFKSLINVNGIGPKLALEILNAKPETVKAAIINEDTTTLSKIPGIGAKTAKRIVLELKGKIEIDNLETNYISAKELNNDALEALMKLGYQRHHITKTLINMPQEVVEAEEIITYFLKNN